MRKVENRRGRRFIDLPRFDPDQPVLDKIDPADSVRSRDAVETTDELHGAQFLSVQCDRGSMEKIDLHGLGFVGGLGRVDGPLIGIGRRFRHRVFEDTAFNACAPDILIDGVRALHRSRDRNTVRPGVLDLFLSRLELPVAQRRDHFAGQAPAR